MNSARPSAIRLCAALALSFLLSAGSAQLSASPLTAGQVPTITISIDGVSNPPEWSWTPSANEVRRATDADGGYELVGQREFDILSNRVHVAIQALRFDPDPFVLNNILVTNTTSTPQTFSAFVGLPTTFGAPNLISGDVRTSVIDGGGGGATVTSVSGQPIYQAQIDFATVATLQNDPFTLVAPPAGSNTAAASFGPNVSAVPVTSNIGIQLRFTLTPGDTAAILSRFDVVAVPEPGSAAFMGLGLALMARRWHRWPLSA
jgi:hypothetical protein